MLDTSKRKLPSAGSGSGSGCGVGSGPGASLEDPSLAHAASSTKQKVDKTWKTGRAIILEVTPWGEPESSARTAPCRLPEKWRRERLETASTARTAVRHPGHSFVGRDKEILKPDSRSGRPGEDPAWLRVNAPVHLGSGGRDGGRLKGRDRRLVVSSG